jgi:hypothetical protein
MRLKPESDKAFNLIVLFGFLLDFFSPSPRGAGFEALNKQRPGWMCKNCGWETRVKAKS